MLDLKEKCTMYIGISTKEKWFVRSSRSSHEAKQSSILPHILAVLGIVCGTDTNSQYTRDEDFAKSRMSQDVTPSTSLAV